jgi:hypothetical protein
MNLLDRREFLLALGGSAAALSSYAKELSSTDEQFLEELERTTLQYFLAFTEPSTGLVKDRNHVKGDDPRGICSISATGFGLTALCIADSRRWLNRGEARERARTALRFIATRLPHEHGFFYHFVDWRSGERLWKCELSSIDTALLLAGVLTCRSWFSGDREIRRLTSQIYDRVEWDWMLNGERTLSMGWKPESGFLASRWNKYCELMILYILAIGSNRHPIPADSWHAWRRPTVEYKGYKFLSDGAPLFVHQFSHAWIDFRGQRDAYADYFENSVIATKAHRQFCIDLKSEFPSFGDHVWGITASDSVRGYVGWGGPPRSGHLDGTVVPCAAAGSLPFLPRETVDCLQTLRSRFGNQCWNRFGFVDAFNPLTGWIGPDIVGIDAGITLLMAENLRTGFVWRYFMKNPEVKRAMRLAGFQPSRSVKQP